MPKRPKQLYPSPAFKTGVQNLKSNFSVPLYAVCFFSAANPIEQGYFFKEISFETGFAGLLAECESLERVRAVWKALDQFGSLIARTAYPKLTWLEEEEPNSDAKSPPLNDVVEAAREAGQEEGKRIEELQGAGFVHLPPRPLSVRLAAEFGKEISKDLGFDLFEGFDRHLAEVAKALPKAVKPKESKIAVSEDVRQVLFGQWSFLSKSFQESWSASIEDIASSLECPADENTLGVLRRWGAVIAEGNRRAGCLALFGADVDRHLRLEDTTTADSRKVAKQELLNHDDAMQQLEATALNMLQGVIVGLTVPGKLEASPGFFVSGEWSFGMWYGSRNPSFLFAACMVVSPAIVASIRQYLLVLSNGCGGSEQQDIVDKAMAGAIESSLTGYSEHRTDIDPVTQEVESLFTTLDLAQSAVSDEAFLEVLRWRLNDNLEPSPDLLENGLKRIKSILMVRDVEVSVPENIDTLDGLGECLGTPVPRFGWEVDAESEASSIYMLAALLIEDKYDYGEDSSSERSSDYLGCTSRLIRDGFVETAGFVFCYFLITESFETSIYLKRNSRNSLYPIGDWAAICGIAEKLASLGWGKRIQATFSVAAEFLQLTKAGNLGFAAAQLLALSGNSILSEEGKKVSAEVLHLSPDFSKTHRDRLVEVMGKENWERISTEMQRTLIRLDRNYDLALGDQSAYGGAIQHGHFLGPTLLSACSRSNFQNCGALNLRPKRWLPSGA